MRQLPHWLQSAGRLSPAHGYADLAWGAVSAGANPIGYDVAVLGGWAALFALFAWLIDGQGWRRPVRPLVIFGMNSIAIYMVSEGVAEFLVIRLGPFRCGYRHCKELLIISFIWSCHGQLLSASRTRKAFASARTA